MTDHVPLSTIIGDPMVGEIDYDDDNLVTDVFVIIRSVGEDGRMHTAYTGSDGFHDDELRLGVLDLIHGRILYHAVRNWTDDE